MNIKKIALAAATALVVVSVNAETLRVGSETVYPPFEFLDSASGKYVGFDIDLINAIGKKAGFDVQIYSMGLDGLVPALVSGSIDVALSALTITPERAAKVDFSDPYYKSGLSIMTHKDNVDKIKGAKDLEGKKVVVVGGGNVAMDAARTALRLGAETHIVYRRSEAELPARKEEVHHAKEEGVIFDLLENPTEILVDENGWVKGVKLIKMELGEPDASGRRSPVEIAGSEYEMECDTVIMSLGTSPNPLISSTTIGLDTNKRKCIVATEDTGATSKEGVFAGGDAVTGAATVILAMGAGKAAAKGIDEFLSAK